MSKREKNAEDNMGAQPHGTDCNTERSIGVKKATVLAIAGVLALTLSSCASSGKSADVSEASQEVEQTATVERATKSTETDDLYQQSQDAIEYMNRPELKNVDQVAQLSVDQVDALAEGDAATVAELDAQIEALCNEVIDMQDIPEIAQRSHDYLIESATCYREASNYLVKASNTSDVAAATGYIEGATDMASLAGQSASLAANAVSDIGRKFE